MPESKPKISDLQKGIICCPGCSFKLNLEQFKTLEVAVCTSCDTPLFIPQKIKHYWLYRPLGGGGMGSVYRALSEEVPGEFAVKVLPRKKRGDHELIETLMMEGKIGKILGKSPYIVEVVDYGFEDGEHFMASRFIEGTRLDIFISAASRLSERQSLDVMIQVLEAEIHIKNCGYLFRDIKPENIIILDETYSVKLFDFGLCISIEHAANPDPEDHLEGSPYYLPPERIVAAPEGEYSEVYSLGMLLFHMLTGTTYFSPSDIKNLVTKHVRSLGVEDAKNRLKHCSPRIIEIIDKMIQSDPNKRYHTLSEVLELVKEASKEASGYPLSPLSEKREVIRETPCERRSLSALSRLNSLIIMLFSAAILYGGWFFWEDAEADREYRSVLNSTAAELGIPADIKSPEFSEKEIREMISEKGSEDFKDQVSMLDVFDKAGAILEICKENSIKPERLTHTYASIKEIKREIKRELNRHIEEAMSSLDVDFPEKRVAREVAEEMHLTLPVSPPLKGVEELKAKAHERSVFLAEEKYPVKHLSKKNMEILKKYRCYKVGERVMFSSRDGEKIKGVYRGIRGGKVEVGERTVVLVDLPKLIRIKFNPALASKRIQEDIKKLTTEFTAEKMRYKQEMYNLLLAKLYRKNGYIEYQGRWLSAVTVFNKLMKQKEEEFENNKLNIEEETIKSVKKRFNKDQFYKRAGYFKIEGMWYSGKELVKIYLKRKKRTFDKQREIKLRELKENILETLEQNLFEKNGYIYCDQQWRPAKEVLELAVEKKIRKKR